MFLVTGKHQLGNSGVVGLKGVTLFDSKVVLVESSTAGTSASSDVEIAVVFTQAQCCHITIHHCRSNSAPVTPHFCSEFAEGEKQLNLHQIRSIPTHLKMQSSAALVNLLDIAISSAATATIFW